jgi:capsular polysaccharide biosynthesis protein
MQEQLIYNEGFEEEISLKEIFTVLKKRLKVIIAITLISTIISAIVTFFILKPEYESKTTLMVGKPVHKIAVDPEAQITYQEIQTNRMLVSTYGELAKSRTVLENVIRNLDLDITSEQLKDKIDVSLVKDTEIIQISVTDQDPKRAAQIANELAKSFSDQVKKTMNVENIQVIDKAVVNENPVKPRHKLNIAIAFVLGLMIGVFTSFVLEYFDTSIKTPEDVSKYLDLPVIGSIPYVEKEGEVQ